MGVVFARGYGDEVPDRAAKNAHGRGELRVAIRCVAVLQHGALEGICVEVATGCGVVNDEALNGFDTHFRSAVTVGKSYR
jgi:hypothetical protein